MAEIFIGYSGRNIKKVSDVVERLANQFGRNRIWFAPERISSGDDVSERLRSAMEASAVFLNFESNSTANLRVDDLSQVSISSREYFLLYERELALNLGLEIFNVAIASSRNVSSEFSGYKTFDLSLPIGSRSSQASLRRLYTAISNTINNP